MKKVRPKRLKLDKTGRWRPQYKGWFFWHHYRNPHNRSRICFCVLDDANEFLLNKHHQDIESVKRYNESRIVKWEPPNETAC